MEAKLLNFFVVIVVVVRVLVNKRFTWKDGDFVIAIDPNFSKIAFPLLGQEIAVDNAMTFS